MNTIKMVDTNDCKVIVEPRKAGDFGFVRIGNMERKAKEEYELCEQIKQDIERHVDDINCVTIEQKRLFTYKDNEIGHCTGETLFDLIYEIAYQKDLIKSYPSWDIEYTDDADKYIIPNIMDFNQLLDYFVQYKDVNITKGNITNEQRILINIAKQLNYE